MKRTFAMARLDICYFKVYIKQIAVAIMFGVLLSLMIKDVMFMTMVLAMVVLLTVGYPFSLGEKYHSEALLGTLPLSKKQMVTGRYLFGLGVILMAGVMMFFSHTLLGGVTQESIEPIATLENTGIAMLIMVLVMSYQYPLFFVMGFEKGRIYGYLPMMLPSVLAAVIPESLWARAMAWIAEIQPAFFVVAVILLLVCSYTVSLKKGRLPAVR